MNFPWTREHHRHQLREKPFPAEWLAILNANVAHYRRLTERERERLQSDLRIVIAEKTWEGANGLLVTDEMRVTIAAQACLLTLGWEPDYFDDIETIIIYPGDFRAKRLGWGFESQLQDAPESGEAWSIGPVILSWQSALAGGRNASDGYNVVLHEFAHRLDMRDGYADGVPPLRTQAESDHWAAVLSAEFTELVRAKAAGEPTLLNPYGATNAAEFFAVATECFFERPRDLFQRHEALYNVLRDYYRQDLANTRT